MLTRDEILTIARQHEQYASSREPTLRGIEAIEAFARAVIAAHEAEMRAVPPLPVIDWAAA
jgi:hypothetical protein